MCPLKRDKDGSSVDWKTYYIGTSGLKKIFTNFKHYPVEFSCEYNKSTYEAGGLAC